MLRALKDPSKSHGPIQAPNGDPDGPANLTQEQIRTARDRADKWIQAQ